MTPLQVLLYFRRFLPAQFCLDKHVDVAIHDILYIAGFCASTMVLHHLVRLENVRPNLTTPCDIPLLAILPIDLGAFFVLFNFVKFCLQHLERELAITPLAALSLASDDESTRLVHNPHSGFDLINVLAAFASTAKGVDLQIGRTDLDRSGIGDLRDNIDTREGSVTPLVCIKRRNPHEPMDPSLGLKMSISVLTAHEQCDRFYANFFALLNVHCLWFETTSFDPALVHAQQHVGPIARLGAASTRMNGEECIRAIILAGKKLTQLEFFKLVN